MPGRDLAALVRDLRQANVAGDMPCVAVSCAATPRQQFTAARLADLAQLSPGPAPLLILVGRAMQPMLDNDGEQHARSLSVEAAAHLAQR